MDLFIVEFPHIVWMEETLQQLADGKHPLIVLLLSVLNSVANSFQLVQNFFHP